VLQAIGWDLLRDSFKWEFQVLYMVLAELLFYGSTILILVFITVNILIRKYAS